jgi:hypothetical protein
VALKISSNRDGALLMIDRTFRSDYNRAELSYGLMHAAVEFYVPNLSTLSSSGRQPDPEPQSGLRLDLAPAAAYRRPSAP